MKALYKSMLFILSFVLIGLTTTFVAPKNVSAGASRNHVLSGISISGNSLNMGDFIIDGGIYAKNSQMRFDKNVISDFSYAIAATKINNLRESGVKDLFLSSMNVSINEFALTDNSKIEFIYGMNSVRNVDKAKDCVKIVFEKNKDKNKIDMTIKESYQDERQDFEILSKATMNKIEFEKPFKLEVNGKTDGSIDILIDNVKVIENYRCNVDLTGYFAICQNGKNDMSISKTEIIAYNYVVAKNVDYLETFENGEYNSNIFYSSAIAMDHTPCSLSVNNGALEFLNTYEGYFSTKYTYSNYELEFDLFDIVNKDIKDENGNVVKARTGRIGIGTGENYKGTIPSFEHEDLWTLLWGDRGSGAAMGVLDRFELRDGGYKSMSSFDIFNDDFVKGRKINVKYTSTDGVLRLYFKFDGEYPYTEKDKEYSEKEKQYYDYKCYLECDTGKAEAGHIKIFSYGYANYKIDNLSITNTDYEGVRQSLTKEEVGFKSNKREKTPDFNYDKQPDETDLLVNKIQNNPSKKGGCKSDVTTSGTVILVALSIALLFVWRKKS